MEFVIDFIMLSAAMIRKISRRTMLWSLKPTQINHRSAMLSALIRQPVEYPEPEMLKSPPASRGALQDAAKIENGISHKQ